LPSQLVTDFINSSQAHVAQEDTTNQCNMVHTLWSRKHVYDQMSMPSDATQKSAPSSSTPSISEDKLAKQVHRLTIPFLNRLRSNNNA